jgi:general secretion pathway protein D
MKTTTLVLILFLTGLDLLAQPLPAMPVINPTNRAAILRRLSARRAATNNPAASQSASAAAPISPALGGAPDSAAQTATGSSTQNPMPTAAAAPAEEMIPPGMIDFEGVDVEQVLKVYAGLVGRTLLRAQLPSASIVLKTETPLTKTEAIEALQAVLALNGIAVVNIGDKFVKVLQTSDAAGSGAALDNSDAASLPELGSYVTHIVHLKYTKPSDIVPIITPLAKVNSIIPIENNNIIVIRDYAENVKRMLEMIDQVDVAGSASEIVSEVIPIKYALADDIANALNSLGGSGSSTTPIGANTTGTTTGGGGMVRPGAATTTPGNGFAANQSPQYGGAAGGAAGGAPARTGTTFQQQIQRIIQRASGSGQPEQIQVFGQAKIIADERSNSLLIFATQTDLDRIKEVVKKLDVLLSQVLIESVIMDVNYGNSWNFGVSASQNQQNLNSSVSTAGGMNNGQPFMNFIRQVGTNLVSSSTNGFPGNFTSALPSGFSYFGDIGPTWDLALQAAANDSTATVIQRPRIQTSQAKEASFFIGSSVPYINGTSYGTGYGGGNSSTYSQLSVGINLDVTPFINPDGLVVMDIKQEIDDISGTTTIDGNPVPNTDQRSFNSEIAVKDKDTIILGGFVRSDKSKSRSGVPLLMDIPFIGNLFTSRNDSKNRDELIVLMRPTVLRSPEIAAQQAVIEEDRLPGIKNAEADDNADAQKLIDAEKQIELKAAKKKKGAGGVFTESATNAPAAQSQAGEFFTPATPAIPAADTNNAAPVNP